MATKTSRQRCVMQLQLNYLLPITIAALDSLSNFPGSALSGPTKTTTAPDEASTAYDEGEAISRLTAEHGVRCRLDRFVHLCCLPALVPQ